jgi:NADPH-dependent 2,4-dienoyl-CoA reductase/sulfur reductase-like enzyme
VRLTGGEVLRARQLLVATGRRTDLSTLGVGAVGLDERARVIEVDERMRAADGVWAIGDVTGKGAFTDVSMYQARIAAADILGENGETANYRAVPRVTFTDSEIGSVGLTEAAARETGVRVRTGLARIPSSARGWIHKVGNEGVVPGRVRVDVLTHPHGVVAGQALPWAHRLRRTRHEELPAQRLRRKVVVALQPDRPRRLREHHAVPHRTHHLSCSLPQDPCSAPH